MKIDLKYLIPLAMPFAIMAFFRVLWFVVGLDWYLDPLLASFAVILGFGGGCFVVRDMNEDGANWTVRVGKSDAQEGRE